MTPTISGKEFDGISTPQTLKIEGYIKKKKVIVLIDSANNHNFIHYKLAKAPNCFVYLAPEFQVMIADEELSIAQEDEIRSILLWGNM